MSPYVFRPLLPDMQPVATYIYKDENGTLHSKIERFEFDDGEKTFRPWHWDDADRRWLKGKPDGPPIPYHLDRLVDAPPERAVFVDEGEKDVDTLTGYDLLATTNANGSKYWTDDHSKWLKGKQKVYVIEDNDDAGRERSKQIAIGIAPLVGELRIVRLPGLPEGEDVTWWLTTGGHTIEEFLKQCDQAEIYKRPEIRVLDGNLVEIVNQAEQALLDADIGIYQRGDELVRAITVGRQSGESEIRRQPGSTILTAVNQVWLREQMARSAFWYEQKSRKLVTLKVPVDPPRDYPQTLMARKGSWHFPRLRAVITAPTMDRTGRIIQLPGYDAASQLLLDFDSGDYPEIPENPTKEDAVAALEMFADNGSVDLPVEKRKGLLRGFPFADGPSRSVALSALMCSLVRVNLKTVPLHAFDAPTAGTGKSMLAEMAGLLSMGQRPAAMSQGKSSDEDEKRLSTVLHAGDPVILIDNVEEPLEGDFLCSMLTQEKVQARILGKSERRVLPSTALVLATGNNLILQGDVSRRAVVCRLDAKQERPDAREFSWDAQADLLDDRPEFVKAALTVLRAYALATDKPKLSAVGSFADWDVVRGAIVWCGYDDPAETRNAILAEDPEKAALIDIMSLWSQKYGDTQVSVAAIGQLDIQHPLRAALTNATAKEGVVLWNSKSVGRWLTRNKDKIIGGQAFRKVGEGLWKLEGTSTTEM